MTNIYIRGVDFKMGNKRALELGGFHAIVTYQIESEADEIQANGRVARQGCPGSIRMVIPQDDLALLEIHSKENGNLP